MSARHPWDRRPGETAKQYEAFRRFRDAGPLRTLAAASETGRAGSHHERWCATHDWRDRAASWDDECYRLDDQRRLDAIRTMYDTHQRAGRVAMAKAVAALSALRPEDVPAYAAARLLELGARLERETLSMSVAELQGMTHVARPEHDDPWEIIARELQAASPSLS